MNQHVYIGKPGIKKRGLTEIVHVKGKIIGFKGKVVKPTPPPPTPYDPN